MAGFFAGCAHAPFSTIIMVSEMTGGYELLLPTMWVSTLCFLLCRRWTLYVKQVPTRLESPAHRGDFIVDILAGIKVRDVFQPGRAIELVPESTPLNAVVRMLAKTEQNYFPVVDGEDRVIGIFSARDVRAFIYDESVWQLAIAKDVMTAEVLSLVPDDSLNKALKCFTVRNIDELPVFDPERPGHLLGMLRRREVIAFYNQQLEEQKQLSA
jgi:CIC family chloride channel protein